MKKVIIILILINLIAFPVYAANRFGVGIDFLGDEKASGGEKISERDIGLRLYYEHLLSQPIGIQAELGISHRDYKPMAAKLSWGISGKT